MKIGGKTSTGDKRQGQKRHHYLVQIIHLGNNTSNYNYSKCPSLGEN